MNDWWECTACTLPNDPRYTCCVNCGGAATAATLLRNSNGRDNNGRAMSSPDNGLDASWVRRDSASNTSSHFRHPSALYAPEDVAPTPLNWRNQDDRGSNATTGRRSTQQPRSSPSRMQLSLATTTPPRHRNAPPPFEELLQRTILPTTSSSIEGGGDDEHRTGNRHALAPSPRGRRHPSPTNDGQLSASAFVSSDERRPHSGTLIAGPSPRRLEGASATDVVHRQRYDADRGTTVLAAHPPSIQDDSTIGGLQGSYLDVGLSVSSPRGAFLDYDSDTSQPERQQTDVVQQLKEQLADALEEVQSTRATCQRALQSKDTELHTLRREVQQWKDEVIAVQKRHHIVNEELRRTSATSAEQSHLVQRLRVDANLRVPHIVAEEFRHRLSTSLDARGEVLQWLSYALQLFHSGLGDRGLSSKYAAQSIEAAALAHSNGIATLRSRVAQLEQELAVYRSGDATRDGDDSGARTDNTL